jgi:hypothetical protein
MKLEFIENLDIKINQAVSLLMEQIDNSSSMIIIITYLNKKNINLQDFY